MLNQSGGETDEHRQLRRAAFLAIVVSTVAVIASIITLPLLYSYVANFQSHLLIETDFCKARSRDMWSEMSHLHKQGLHRRQKRQYGVPASNGYGSPVVNAEPEGCCSCQQGPPGPPGLPGDDGLPGRDAAPGNDAGHGKDGQVLRSAIAPTPCLICPPGVPGQQGPQGKKGPPGPKGKSGNPGTDGKKGQDGLQGPIGVNGPYGPPGGKGPRGAPGRVNEVNGPLGPSGAPGRQGAPGAKGERGQPGRQGEIGQQGLPGDTGRPGQPGRQGEIGQQGLQGPTGESGGCDHCPPPRTPPGY